MEFKVLSYCNNYVDATLLGKGIYFTTKPHLYSDSETIENLIELAEVSFNFGGKITTQYIENLEQCQLTRVRLIKCV